MEELRWHTHSRALSAAAIWSQSSASALGRFERSTRPVPKQTEAPEHPAALMQMFAAAGVPVECL